MKLPDGMFRQELLPYLTVHDIVNLDNACMNHKYRPQLMEKINGVILIGDKVKPTKASLFKWLGMRRIYLIKVKLQMSNLNLCIISTHVLYLSYLHIYIYHIYLSYLRIIFTHYIYEVHLGFSQQVLPFSTSLLSRRGRLLLLVVLRRTPGPF